MKLYEIQPEQDLWFVVDGTANEPPTEGNHEDQATLSEFFLSEQMCNFFYCLNMAEIARKLECLVALCREWKKNLSEKNFEKKEEENFQKRKLLKIARAAQKSHFWGGGGPATDNRTTSRSDK